MECFDSDDGWKKIAFPQSDNISLYEKEIEDSSISYIKGSITLNHNFNKVTYLFI